MFWNGNFLLSGQQSKIDSMMKAVSKELKDSIQVQGLNNLSEQYRLKGNYDSAIVYAVKANELAVAIKYDIGISNSLNFLGIAQWKMGNLPMALESFLGALKINERIGFHKGIASNEGNIGIIYKELKDYDAAITYTNLSLKENQYLNNRKGEAACYNGIGNIYKNMQRYSESLANHFKSVEIKKAIGDNNGLAFSYNNIGIVYSLIGLHDSCIHYLRKSLDLFREFGDEEEVCNTSISLGQALLKTKDLSGAKSFLDDGFVLAKRIRSLSDLRAVHEGYSDYYLLMQDDKKGFENYKLMISYRDSIYNEVSTRKTVQLQMRYDFDKKTATDSIRNAEQKKREDLKHAQEIKQQKLYTYGGVVGFVLMMIVAIISIRAFTSKLKANEIISLQKSLVEEKQKEILDSIHYAKRIQKSLLPTEKYIQKNINRLKN